MKTKQDKKMTKLDLLLDFLYHNPGATRAQISAAFGKKFSRYGVNLYLSVNYGYRWGTPSPTRRGKFRPKTNDYGRPRPAYFSAVDFKPAKGRIINTYYLTELGQQRIEKIMKYV